MSKFLYYKGSQGMTIIRVTEVQQYTPVSHSTKFR